MISTFESLRRARGVPVLDGSGALLASGLLAATSRAAAGCSVQRAATSQRSGGLTVGAQLLPHRGLHGRRLRRRVRDGLGRRPRLNRRTGAFTSAPDPVGPDAASSGASTVSAGAGPGEPG